MTAAFIVGGMKSVSRALNAALLNSTASVPAFSSTKLCAIAIFGIVPTFFSTMRSVSPGLAVISALSYFMLSPPVISTVRAAAAGADLDFAAGALALAGGGAWAPAVAPSEAMARTQASDSTFI